MTIALITGASSGIGRAAATSIARTGAGVVLTYRGNRAGADEAVAEIRAAGGQAAALSLDLGDSASFVDFRERLTQILAAEWGTDTINVLVNNGGFSAAEPYAELSEQTFDHLADGLLKGPFFLTQALLPLLADGGSIINVTSSSTAPMSVTPGYSAYAAMKGALVVLTRYQAKELSGRGVRVNSVSPGPTLTRLGNDGFSRNPDVIPMLAERTALGRVGEGRDVGDVIAFLASDASRWVTAQDIEVSGGFGL
ncbi:SDR family NAD(P)-dependent oxidoreductase [Mycetocola saprophilus]|uniref:SDR family NAD(P)-dependent oxidoreductase n=1 Tax=Mycetocola saprophilus TaxID=76636 RepID=UPI0004C04B68|nr:SDR family oxidoreductase [Mycetocola saprophilus]